MQITVKTIVHAPIEKVWAIWNNPEDIKQWCHASEDWEAPNAANDLRVGGTFKTTMAAKDGSVSFDFGGVYDKVVEFELIEYSMEDGRKVKIQFKQANGGTEVTEIFDAEEVNPEEMQRDGWQAILNNFKAHVEAVQ